MCTFLIASILEIAKRNGKTKVFGQLMASNMAGGLSEKLGFNTAGVFTPYTYAIE
jgi:hypothetical protein